MQWIFPSLTVQLQVICIVHVEVWLARILQLHLAVNEGKMCTCDPEIVHCVCHMTLSFNSLFLGE